VVPFLIAGMIYGAEGLQNGGGSVLFKEAGRKRSWEKDAVFSIVLAGLFSLVFVPTPQSILARALGIQNSTFRVTSRDRFVKAWLREHVPEGAPLMADSYLAPHLVNRETLYSNYYTDGPGYLRGEQLERALAEVDYVALDAFSVYARIDAVTITAALESPDFELQQAQDGLLLFGRGKNGLEQEIHVTPQVSSGPYLAAFGDAIGLVDFAIDEIGPGRYRFRFDWAALKALNEIPERMAITRLAGVENASIVHLPGMALLPTAEWPVGKVVREEFEFEAPEGLEPGRYILSTAWYDRSSLDIEGKSGVSRVGAEVRIGWLEIGH
jgi:hypothetical protein